MNHIRRPENSLNKAKFAMCNRQQEANLLKRSFWSLQGLCMTWSAEPGTKTKWIPQVSIRFTRLDLLTYAVLGCCLSSLGPRLVLWCWIFGWWQSSWSGEDSGSIHRQRHSKLSSTTNFFARPLLRSMDFTIRFHPRHLKKGVYGVGQEQGILPHCFNKLHVIKPYPTLRFIPHLATNTIESDCKTVWEHKSWSENCKVRNATVLIIKCSSCMFFVFLFGV